MLQYLRSLLLIGLMVFLPATALADYTMSSGAGFFWQQPGGVAFDSFDTYITGGSENFSNAIIDGDSATIGYSGSFNLDGWSGIFISNTHSHAQGPAVTTLNWDYNFTGTSPVYPFTFDINYFLNNVFVIHEHYTITGFNNNNYTGYVDYSQYVPLPAAAVLMAAGLARLAAYARRRRSRA